MHTPLLRDLPLKITLKMKLLQRRLIWAHASSDRSDMRPLMAGSALQGAGFLGQWAQGGLLLHWSRELHSVTWNVLFLLAALLLEGLPLNTVNSWHQECFCQQVFEEGRSDSPQARCFWWCYFRRSRDMDNIQNIIPGMSTAWGPKGLLKPLRRK